MHVRLTPNTEHTAKASVYLYREAERVRASLQTVMASVYLYVLEDKARSEAAKELVLESLLDLSMVCPHFTLTLTLTLTPNTSPDP